MSLTSAPPPAPLDRLRALLRVRRFDEQLIELSGQHAFGHFHVSIGQEVVAVAAMEHVDADDLLVTTHRNHAHLVARGADPRRLYAEMLGRATGYGKGKSGTLHGTVRELGFLSTSAIVGGAIPIATGAAFAAQQHGRGQVCVGFFGDGAIEEGVFFESLNFAALLKAPVVYVCENNSLGAPGGKAGEYPSSTLATGDLASLVRPFGMAAEAVDGADLEAVSAALQAAVQRARSGGGPTFVEARAQRWPGSRPIWPTLLGARLDVAMTWEAERIPADYQTWFAQHDGVLRYVRRLLEQGQSRSDILALDRQVTEDLRAAAEQAVADPCLSAAEALATDGVSAEVVDLRTLVPLDRDTLLGSVARTGRVVIVDEAHLSAGGSAEIAALIAQEGFHALRAPIERVATADVPIPFSPPLEEAVAPTVERIRQAALTVVGEGAPMGRTR